MVKLIYRRVIDQKAILRRQDYKFARQVQALTDE